jgi:endonuclease V-like protein UPF0215 family
VVSRDNTFTSCIGIEDGPFLPRRLGGSRAPLVAVKLDGPHMTGVRAGWIGVDGLDGTDQALKLLSSLSVAGHPILLAGVTFGGFNLIDPRRLQKKFRTPTIVVVGYRPDNRAVKRALVRHFPDWRERWQIIRSLGPLRSVRTVESENPIFYEMFGCSSGVARKILTSWAMVSRIPEPLRVAGLVARGLFPAQPLG